MQNQSNKIKAALNPVRARQTQAANLINTLAGAGYAYTSSRHTGPNAALRIDFTHESGKAIAVIVN